MATANVKDKQQERRDRLQDRLDIDNVEAVPEIEKVIINVGIGDARDNLNRLETVEEHLGRIAGQKPVVTRAKKSVAGFNLRKGDPCGVKVSLRGQRMVEFLRRLIHVALPRTKDFRGLDPNSFDGNGNYTLGINEQAVFPEVSYEEVDEVFGMDITVTTTTSSDEHARALLEEYNFPLKEE